MKIARITLSDRASAKIYEDISGPEIERIVSRNFTNKIDWRRALLPDDMELLKKQLIHFCDHDCCDMILTTGGTGPSLRDITPEVTRSILEKELMGFGEAMRMLSFPQIPTAILSRATAGIRRHTFILNLPGKPKAISECLPPLIPAIQEALHHISHDKKISESNAHR